MKVRKELKKQVIEHTVYNMIEGEMDLLDGVQQALKDINHIEGTNFTEEEKTYFTEDLKFNNKILDEYDKEKDLM